MATETLPNAQEIQITCHKKCALTVGFRLGEETFRARAEIDTLKPHRTRIDDADLVLTNTHEMMAS